MAGNPSQEDVAENPQCAGAQNGRCVLESSHRNVLNWRSSLEDNSSKGVQEQKQDWER
jgi:hypothetical protein